MKMTFGDFLNVLYGNMAGVIVMTVCLCVYIAGLLYRKKDHPDRSMIKGAEMKWKRIKKTIRENPVYLKAGILAAAAVICFVCLYIWDNSREIRTNENGEKILEREENGEDQTRGMKVPDRR